MGWWSSGMILASGARGRGFDSPPAPFTFDRSLLSDTDTVAEWLRR